MGFSVLLLCAACAGAPAPLRAPAPVASAVVAMPAAIHWSRNSAEHTAAFVQTYRWAIERVLEVSSGRTGGTWGVIMDADETVIDNSTYQKERAEADSGYTDATWDAWIAREQATALPGAAEFIRVVREQGGRVVIVTNRTAAQCPATQSNFRKLGIVVDAMLCRTDTSDKNPRFARVLEGRAQEGVPALEVLLWVGDNIQDFPGFAQEVRAAGEAAFAGFGVRFVVLPNPMYGSWERNPAR
jgi:5'-nucleotidase (lipoprotein e(P4) family)